MTKVQTYKVVSAGFALGLVMNGRGKIGEASTWTFDRAFWTAWHRWSASKRFPKINPVAADNEKCLKPSRFIHKYGVRVDSVGSPLRWDGENVGARKGAYDPEEHEYYASRIDEKISAEEWKDLVRDVLDTEREYRSED